MNTSNTDSLRDAAQAVVDRWDTPLWKDAEPTAAVIGRLRAAIEADRSARAGVVPSAHSQEGAVAIVAMVLQDMNICCGELGADYEFTELSTETVAALRAFDFPSPRQPSRADFSTANTAQAEERSRFITTGDALTIGSVSYSVIGRAISPEERALVQRCADAEAAQAVPVAKG